MNYAGRIIAVTGLFIRDFFFQKGNSFHSVPQIVFYLLRSQKEFRPSIRDTATQRDGLNAAFTSLNQGGFDKC